MNKCTYYKNREFLASLYEFTGRAIALFPASAAALAVALWWALVKYSSFRGGGGIFFFILFFYDGQGAIKQDILTGLVFITS